MAVKCSSRTLWTTADENGYPYWVEFEDRPFAKGNSKFMYKGRLNGKGPRSGDYCTLKVFRTIDIAQQADWNLYISRIERANELAAQFNKMIDNQYKVKFLVPMTALVDISSTCTDCIYFMSNTKRIRSDDCVAVEPYIGHKFRKFYRNSPLKGAEYAYILQAFSHFTASQTGDTLICGLQGVAQGTEFILTNPIIHSSNQEWGPKDQGPQGFRKFFSAHTCNDICRSLDLPDYLETISVTEEVEKEIVEKDVDEKDVDEKDVDEKDVDEKDAVDGETSKKLLEAPIVSEEASQVTELEAETIPKAEAQVSEAVKEKPASRAGSTIIAPVSVEVVASRTSSVTGPPELAEDLPGEIVSQPSAESVILDATPIDDIAPQLSSSQEVIPPDSSEYIPCKQVEEYLELKKNCASFSPGSETIPMIDDELACAESEKREVLPPPTDDFEPTISPSLSSYLKDKESLEIMESKTSISEDHVSAAELGSTDNIQVTPRESVSHDAEVFEETPAGTVSQASLVTTPSGSVHKELDSQPSVDPAPKDSVSEDLIPVSEPLLKADVHSDSQEGAEGPPDVESQVCLVSIPPDCMDHHLDTHESLEALSPVSEELASAELGEESVEPGSDHVVEEQVSAEVSETKPTQETSTETLETYPLDNVEVEVHKSECEDAMSSDFKQSLETIPEGSTESDSAHSLENENLAPEVSTEVDPDKSADDTAADGTSGKEETAAEKPEATPKAVVSEKTVVDSKKVTVEPATEVPAAAAAEVATAPEETTETAAQPSGEATVSEKTTVETAAEPAVEAKVSQETTVETAAKPVEEAKVSQETIVKTAAEPAGEAKVSQETIVKTAAEPAGEAKVSQETPVESTDEPSSEAKVSEETAVETTAEPVGETTVSQETKVEPAGEAADSQETPAEPAGEHADSQETPAEPAGESADSKETPAEPAGESADSKETPAEPAGEHADSQETPAEPAGESVDSKETPAEPVGQSVDSQETPAEPVGQSADSQETPAEPVGQSADSQETPAEPVGQSADSQETPAEPVGQSADSQETPAEPVGQSADSQETPAEPVGEAAVAQGTEVETKVESNVNQEITEPNSQKTETGEANVSQDTVMETTKEADVSQEAVIETTGVSSQDLVVESTDEMPGESYVSHDRRNTGSGSTAEMAGEAYVSPETTGGSSLGATSDSNVCHDSYLWPKGKCCRSRSSGLDSNVEPTADGYTSQDSVFDDSNQDQSYNDPRPTTYSQSYIPVTSSYPTQAINTITSQIPDTYYYGVPPEYRISENCDSFMCEPGCPQRFTKMTIVPDLDTMEYVETKCLDPVYEEHDNQQGIETLPRRSVSYYLEPQESHEIITFSINISPELPRPGQEPGDCVYQNVGTARQSSNQGEMSLSSSNYCPNCHPRETSENVGETSGPDSEGSTGFYTYHYTDTSDCTETMPQRSCGYSTEVHQNMSSDWSPTHSNWDEGQCSTAQNLSGTAGEKVDSKFGSSV